MHPRLRLCLSFTLLAVLAAMPASPVRAASTEPAFAEAEVRAAIAELEQLLQAPDMTAWVEAYTRDAVFVGSSGPAVAGRAALLEVARKMKPLYGIKITPLRIEGTATLAYVYAKAAWADSPAAGAPPVIRVRSLLVLRKETDGKWRVTQELLHADPDPA